MYDRVLGSDLRCLSPYQLPKDLVDQLRISQFCNTITKTLYCHSSEPSGVIPDEERATTMDQLNLLYARLEAALGAEISSKLLTC